MDNADEIKLLEDVRIFLNTINVEKPTKDQAHWNMKIFATFWIFSRSEKHYPQIIPIVQLTKTTATNLPGTITWFENSFKPNVHKSNGDFLRAMHCNIYQILQELSPKVNSTLKSKKNAAMSQLIPQDKTAFSSYIEELANWKHEHERSPVVHMLRLRKRINGIENRKTKSEEVWKKFAKEFLKECFERSWVEFQARNTNEQTKNITSESFLNDDYVVECFIAGTDEDLKCIAERLACGINPYDHVREALKMIPVAFLAYFTSDHIHVDKVLLKGWMQPFISIEYLDLNSETDCFSIFFRKIVDTMKKDKAQNGFQKFRDHLENVRKDMITKIRKKIEDSKKIDDSINTKILLPSLLEFDPGTRNPGTQAFYPEPRLMVGIFYDFQALDIITQLKFSECSSNQWLCRLACFRTVEITGELSKYLSPVTFSQHFKQSMKGRRDSLEHPEKGASQRLSWFHLENSHYVFKLSDFIKDVSMEKKRIQRLVVENKVITSEELNNWKKQEQRHDPDVKWIEELFSKLNDCSPLDKSLPDYIKKLTADFQRHSGITTYSLIIQLRNSILLRKMSKTFQNLSSIPNLSSEFKSLIDNEYSTIDELIPAMADIVKLSQNFTDEPDELKSIKGWRKYVLSDFNSRTTYLDKSSVEDDILFHEVYEKLNGQPILHLAAEFFFLQGYQMIAQHFSDELKSFCATLSQNSEHTEIRQKLEQAENKPQEYEKLAAKQDIVKNLPKEFTKDIDRLNRLVKWLESMGDERDRIAHLNPFEKRSCMVRRISNCLGIYILCVERQMNDDYLINLVDLVF